MQQASGVIERIAVSSSSSVFVYDLAEHAGFGQLSKKLDSEFASAKVHSLQTRAGAGLNLAGRLSKDGSSKDTEKDSTLTAYTTPVGLAAMASSFAYLPEPSPASRIVIQVPALTSVGPSLELSPSLAPLNTVLGTLPENFTVLFSSTPQESVNLAAAAYKITDSHVVHIFDHYTSARELGHSLSVPSTDVEAKTVAVSARDVLRDSLISFDYAGDSNATDAIVLLNGTLASSAKTLVKDNGGLGVLAVRVLRPWDVEQLVATLPPSVKKIHVVDEVTTEGTQGALYTEVFASFLGSKAAKPTVRPIRIVPSRTQELVKSPSAFVDFLESIVPQSASLKEDGRAKKLLFFGTPNSGVSNLPSVVTRAFEANKAICTQSVIEHDVFSKPGGIEATRIVLTPTTQDEVYAPVHAQFTLGRQASDPKADFVAILDQSLLKTHVIDKYLKYGAVVLLFSTWNALELASNVPATVLKSLRELNVALYNVDVKALDLDAEAASIVGHLIFLRLYLGQIASEAALKKIAQDLYPREGIAKLNAKAWAALERISIPAESPENESADQDLKSFEFNAVVGDVSIGESPLPGSHMDTWHRAARHILFADAFNAVTFETEDEYPVNPALRPELPERTYLVSCSVNRRLTPLDYDRNVFHLEFDTKGTGLKYEIGEALGVHGWNDADDVLDFCKWYGVSPDRLITIPVPGVESQVHTRTIFQALQQQIDLFGKPPKSFYADLSNHATSKNDKLILQFVGSPEGSSMFKKLSEKETVTFADLLKEYKSARPSIEVLCQMIGDIKPRHYSIASAQSVVGDRVDLLVVTVEWASPSGSPRFGQCTRYLAGLKVGQKVTVSIKPSVMKLPPSDMQPLILAGLGTGAAPFRAFLQHRALLASQGKPVGPLYYYFGSRYRSKEYLYGEEIEAFMLDKTITKAGLAFSRDGRKKVYIQHKMVEDADDLAKMLYKDEGVFYLCGPTWPVPDVYEALVTALKKTVGWDEKTAGDYLEGLKEEERYVLEVY